ncbi:MAG: HAD family hydrolase [Zestosphaera sp.]
MIRLVIFDVWDTLLSLEGMQNALASKLHGVLGIKSREEILEAIKAVRDEVRSLRVYEVSASEVVPTSRIRLCNKLGIGLEDFLRVHEILVSEAKEGKLNHLVIDDVDYVMSYIKNAGLKVAVLGNVLLWDSIVTESILNSSGLGKFVDRYFFSDRLGLQKPEFEAFANVLKSFGVKAGEAIHVGDNVREDFGGALAAGLKAILINRKVRSGPLMFEEFAVVPEIKYVAHVIDEWIRR